MVRRGRTIRTGIVSRLKSCRLAIDKAISLDVRAHNFKRVIRQKGDIIRNVVSPLFRPDVLWDFPCQDYYHIRT